MRKKSREMDTDWAADVLRHAPYITVSFTREDGTAYGVPLSLAEGEEGVWYFHAAPEGDKLECIKHNNLVWLSAVSLCKPMVGPKDGSFTLEYKSAMAQGRAEIVTDDEERKKGLYVISKRFLPQHMDAFDESVNRSLHRVVVVRITLVAPPTGKRKKYDKNGDEMKYGRME